MKVNARQRAHRKYRRDSDIVGQATTNEPIDTRVRACYANSTHVLVGSGGARHRFDCYVKADVVFVFFGGSYGRSAP